MIKIVDSKIFVALLLLLVVFLTGVFGFYFFSNYTWIDALYMTVITITTVGYGEVMPLSPQEKVFVTLLIISSIFIAAYSFSVITEYIYGKNMGHFQENIITKN